MTFRVRFLAGATTWAVLVTASLIAIPWSLRNHLPAPVASHWGFSGTPDSAMSLAALTGFSLGLWALFALGGLALTKKDGLFTRSGRVTLLSSLGFGGVLAPGVLGITAWANWEIADWHQAHAVNWQVLPLLGAAVLVGLLGFVLGRLGPDAVAESDDSAPMLALEPGKRAVWMGSGTNRILAALSLALVLAPVVFVAVRWPGSEVPTWITAISLELAGLVTLALSSVRVNVGQDGVGIAFGPLRWPVRRIRLDRIETARPENRQALAYGGWGYRGVPGRMTIMVRGGDCLVLRYESGKELGISVDDAERGAALLNSLVASSAPDPRSVD